MFDLFEPYLVEILGTIVTALVGFVALQVKRWTGIQIDEKHMRALHSAIMTGVQVGIYDSPSAGVDAIVERAIEYARESVPDAIARLAPSNPILRKLAKRYVRQALDQISLIEGETRFDRSLGPGHT